MNTVKLTTKTKITVVICIANFKQVLYKENEYIRILYDNHTEISVAVNKASYGFNIDYEATPDEVNKVAMEFIKHP